LLCEVSRDILRWLHLGRVQSVQNDLGGGEYSAIAMHSSPTRLQSLRHNHATPGKPPDVDGESLDFLNYIPGVATGFGGPQYHQLLGVNPGVRWVQHFGRKVSSPARGGDDPEWSDRDIFDHLERIGSH